MEFSSQTTVPGSVPKRTLVIMAKAPRPGMVKTRLAEILPAHSVTALYCCLLEDTVALARSLTGVQLAVMCPEADREELATLLGGSVSVVPQMGEGLAAGLDSVFRHFTAGGGKQVIAFNSDSPHLAPSVLRSAFDVLSAHDMVVGPTHDGGYYLVGAKMACPSLFQGDGLGTRTALDRLLAQAKVLGLSTGLTPSFYDIDIPEDLLRLRGELQLAPMKAPRTAAWFAQWKEAASPLGQGPF